MALMDLWILSVSHFHHWSFCKRVIISGENRLRISFAGIPPTTEYGSTSFVTTARVPIIAPSPIVNPSHDYCVISNPHIIADYDIAFVVPCRSDIRFR